MSNMEKAVSILGDFSETQLGNVIIVLQAMKQTIEDAVYDEEPNAETIAAMEEVNEMIRTGSGQHFKGSAAELFAMLDAEDYDDA